MAERDVLGRLRREYYERIHPFERYTDAKFIARYRINKVLAAELADEFGQSDFATRGTLSGGGLSHHDQVSVLRPRPRHIIYKHIIHKYIH